MPLVVRLAVHLAASGETPTRGSATVGEARGGPPRLLRWLETTLGLQAAPVPVTARVAAYARALAAADGASYRASLSADLWSTASALLLRRDALRLAGWDGRDDAGLPPLVRDLAGAERAGPLPPGEADRLDRVLAALDAGQRLPAHVVVLADPLEAWPAAWRRVLARLTVEGAPPVQPAAADAPGTLGPLQDLARGADAHRDLGPDASFRFAEARSAFAACQAVAAMLAEEPEALQDTVVLCEDDAAALLLDQALARLGLPTMGAGRRSGALPSLQVLPLALELCWHPVDPARLLEFLTLPYAPLHPYVRRRLADALHRQPGLGSRAWERVVAELTAPDRDADGGLADDLRAWLEPPRVARGEALPADLVAQRCGLVAQWAMGQAAVRAGADADEARGFLAAAAQAAAVGELAPQLGATITEAQLDRLLDAVRHVGAEVQPRPAQARGPLLVRSLAEVPQAFARLVWLGVGTADPPLSPWTPGELEALRAAAVEMDDGSRALRTLRAAERRGFARIRERVLVVRVPEDSQRRTHPLWLQLHAALERVDGKPAAPVSLEDALGKAQAAQALEPWSLRAAERPLEAAPMVRPVWAVPPELLVVPEHGSATELQERLACPMKWTFGRVAKLRPGPSAAPPGDFLVQGNLCHAILAEVLGSGGPLPSPEEAATRVRALFDARLPLDAATLAMPAKRGEAMRLRRQLGNAAGRLVEVLHRGGYRVLAMEGEVRGPLLGRPMWGNRDCLVGTDDGHEAVLDFKLTGSKHKRKIAAGNAVQLAIYAATREAETGRPVEAMGYLVVADGQLHTPDGSPLRGAPWTIAGAPSVAQVWRRFAAALGAADGWLQTGLVPARPLQPPETWPADAAMVLDQGWSGRREPCEHCPYDALCGRGARE